MTLRGSWWLAAAMVLGAACGPAEFGTGSPAPDGGGDSSQAGGGKPDTGTPGIIVIPHEDGSTNVTDTGPSCGDACLPPADAGPVCGNGVLEQGEACDDGNTL